MFGRDIPAVAEPALFALVLSILRLRVLSAHAALTKDSRSAARVAAPPNTQNTSPGATAMEEGSPSDAAGDPSVLGQAADVAWIFFCLVLVILMQAGFTCYEVTHAEAA